MKKQLRVMALVLSLGLLVGATSIYAGPTAAVDPSCVKTLTEWCNSNTSLNSTQCFEYSGEGCRAPDPGYAKCVIDTAVYCNSNTSLSKTDCFKKALYSCTGRSRK